MYLLHTKSLRLELHIGTLPRYAILSHTWDQDEVLYNDAERGCEHWKHKKGAFKVISSARIAAEKNFEYIWTDTCCIDKKSSAELSEAINFMYAWYKTAGVCIAWLADFPRNESKTWLGKCRWFDRGWTLQELVAPGIVEFYNLEWEFIGDRLVLGDIISARTEISISVLNGSSVSLNTISVHDRMRWASKRQTTRAEDAAYCLLGMFNVNMPLLYGEGSGKAFHRLQEEIIKTSNDNSLLYHSGPNILAQELADFDDGLTLHVGQSTSQIQRVKGGVKVSMLHHAAHDVLFLDGSILDQEGADIGLRPIILVKPEGTKYERTRRFIPDQSNHVLYYGDTTTIYSIFRATGDARLSLVSVAHWDLYPSICHAVSLKPLKIDASKVQRQELVLHDIDYLTDRSKPKPWNGLLRVDLTPNPSCPLSIGRCLPRAVNGLMSLGESYVTSVTTCVTVGAPETPLPLQTSVLVRAIVELQGGGESQGQVSSTAALIVCQLHTTSNCSNVLVIAASGKTVLRGWEGGDMATTARISTWMKSRNIFHHQVAWLNKQEDQREELRFGSFFVGIWLEMEMVCEQEVFVLDTSARVKPAFLTSILPGR